MERLSLISLVIVTLIVFSASIILAFYGSPNRSPKATTETVTITSVNTIIRLVTTTSSPSIPPPFVIVNGTVSSEVNYPVEIDFCTLTNEVISPQNLAVGGISISGVNCSAYSSQVEVTNETEQNIGNENVTYFGGTYSARVPNNATYLLEVRLHFSTTGPSFEEQAGWLPLNYTVSPQITGYGVDCFNLLQNGSVVFECSSGFG